MVETEDAWTKIEAWLARGRMLDRVQAMPRIVGGCRAGRKLMIDNAHLSILTALQLRFSTASE